VLDPKFVAQYQGLMQMSSQEAERLRIVNFVVDFEDHPYKNSYRYLSYLRQVRNDPDLLERVEKLRAERKQA